MSAIVNCVFYPSTFPSEEVSESFLVIIGSVGGSEGYFCIADYRATNDVLGRESSPGENKFMSICESIREYFDSKSSLLYLFAADTVTGL